MTGTDRSEPTQEEMEAEHPLRDEPPGYAGPMGRANDPVFEVVESEHTKPAVADRPSPSPSGERGDQ